MSSTADQHPSTSAEKLCEQCHKLSLRHFLAPQRIRLFWNLPDAISFDNSFGSSSQTSCALCRIMAQAIQSTPEDLIKIRFETFGTTQTLEGYSTEAFCMRASTKNSLRVAALGLDSYRLGARRHTYGRNVQQDRTNRDLVKTWLRHCESQHRECSKSHHKSADSTPVPQYVVDVEEMRVKEVNGQKPRYLALSYVWGQIPSLQLLNCNIKELTIPKSLQTRLHKLSSVVRDAIAFTQGIQERYLWVDSLCICQDDISIKHAQIAAMNMVYADAIMTLVAMEGDASYGLPGVRPYPKPRHQLVERVHGIRLMTLMPDLPEIEINSAWRNRAWTYQEELFSRRLLFFTDHQAYFRCQASTYCEDRYENFEDQSTVFGESLWIYPSSGLGELPSSQSYTTWKRLVENFSARAFTFDIDRYNAFAGIENQLAHYWNFPCSIGMSLHNLVQQLYWTHNLDPKGRVHRISNYPSWSWCGWSGGVTFPRIDLCIDGSGIRLSNEAISPASNSSGPLEPSRSISTQYQQQAKFTDSDALQPLELVFSAFSSSMTLDTSQHAINGLIFITTEPAKIWGVIHAQHLPPSTLLKHGSTGECIMIGSYFDSNSFNSCNFTETGDPEFRQWFWPPLEQDYMNVVSINHAAQLKFFSTLRLNNKLEHSPAESEPGMLWEMKWWLRLHGLGWVYNVITIIWILIALPFGIAAIAVLIATFVALVALAIGLLVALVALAIGLLGIALGLVVSALIVVPLAVALFLVLISAIQTMFNWIVPPTRKWYFWDSLVSTKFGKWLESKTIDHLPTKWQRLFYRALSKPIFHNDISDSDWQKYRRYNIVNIMLVSRRSENGRDVCERLAIGAMDATCWWKSGPRRREIILQ